MSATVTIRNVPSDAHDELKRRAGRHGHSLQEYVREYLTRLASKPEINALVDSIRERKQRTGTNVSVETILADLHSGRP